MAASATPASSARTSPPRAFGRYELRQLLGKSAGSMAWLAFDPRLGQEVMLTLPRVQPHDAEALELRLREMKQAARLNHPNLAHVIEVGVQDHWPYLACDRALGLTLGADIPVCLHAKSALVSGIGEIVEPVETLPPCWLVLVNPGVAVPTAEVFRRLTARSFAVAPPFASATARELAMRLDQTTNDLAPPAKTIAPVIMQAENALVATDGCLIARMSGSGATCFGLYATKESAEAAARAISGKHPGWWVKAASALG